MPQKNQIRRENAKAQWPTNRASGKPSVIKTSQHIHMKSLTSVTFWNQEDRSSLERTSLRWMQMRIDPTGRDYNQDKSCQKYLSSLQSRCHMIVVEEHPIHIAKQPIIKRNERRFTRGKKKKVFQKSQFHQYVCHPAAWYPGANGVSQQASVVPKASSPCAAAPASATGAEAGPSS